MADSVTTVPAPNGKKYMIAFEVRVNGKRICIAGANDLGVLSAHITASGKLGSKTVLGRRKDAGREVFYSIGGLTARPYPKKDAHLNWKSISPLRIGDVVQLRVLEAKKADRAKSRKRAIRARNSSRADAIEAEEQIMSLDPPPMVSAELRARIG